MSTLPKHLKVAGALLLLFFFSSCRTAREKSNRELDSALRHDTANVLDRLRKIAPCVDGKVTGMDSTAYKKWKAAFDSIAATISKVDPPPAIPDTVRIKEKQKCPALQGDRDYYKTLSERQAVAINAMTDKLAHVEAIHDTVPVKDMADVLTAQNETAEANKAKVKAQGKADFWFYWSIISTLLLLLAVIAILLLIKTRKP